MNHSSMVCGQNSVGSFPESAQIVFFVRPGGRTKSLGGISFRASTITSWKIGPAPVTPLVSFIGALFALPTHTATILSGVYPTVQLSRELRVVPVFAATGRGKLSGGVISNSGRRAPPAAGKSV